MLLKKITNTILKILPLKQSLLTEKRPKQNDLSFSLLTRTPLDTGSLRLSNGSKPCSHYLTYYRGTEYFILFVIALNSLALALDDYSDRDSLTRKNQIIDTSLTVFTYVFAVECLLKVIANGFILHKGAYLRDWWNVIDFVVVISG